MIAKEENRARVAAVTGANGAIGMAIALALAMALNRPLRGIKALRTIYYMPAVTSIVFVSQMWKFLYNKDLGIFN